MNKKTPVTIFTGFLGSGKTTVISNLLHSIEDRRTAVLVNEFGEVSIDGYVLKQHEERAGIKVIPLTVSLAGYEKDTEFDSILQALASERPRFEHVIIETSGLVVPTGIIERLQTRHSENFVLDATFTLVDTPWLLSHPFAQTTNSQVSATEEVFQRQLAAADVVVLNKIDGLNELQLHHAEHELRERCSTIRFLELAWHAKLDAKVALGLRLNQFVASNDAKELVAVGMHSHSDGHAHSGLGEHAHGLHTHTHLHEHDPGWISFTLHSHERQDEQSLVRGLAQLAHDSSLMRFKGSANLACGKAAVVHGVRDRVTVEPEMEAGHKAQDHSELVFIGYHLDREHVARVLNESTSGDWH
ncbi:MAG: GTP-binding protein [Candidatus Obscuribacterales bacterium]|nr:GTP-binding protein [Candidatus Obscuribacterales bacterium]